MKLQFLALSLIALAPLPSWAQTPQPPEIPKAPLLSEMDPAVRAIVERAIGTYKGATRISYNVNGSIIGIQTGPSRVRYLAPDKLKILTGGRGLPSQDLFIGSDLTKVIGNEYGKFSWPSGRSPLTSSEAGNFGMMIAAMIAGEAPIGKPSENLSVPGLADATTRTVVLKPRKFDGELLDGIEETSSIRAPGDKSPTITQTRAWFGGTPYMLRRVESNIILNGEDNINLEVISDQKLSPEFPPSTFVFNPAGLKLVDEKVLLRTRVLPPKPRPEFDPRLKVGAAPLPFAAKDLQGKPVSLAAVRGKVVLLHFWAAWSPPAVQALPEIKRAYSKYHLKGLEVVGVSLDENRAALASFIKKNKMPWPQVFDGKGWNSRVPASYGVKAIPFVLLIGKNGKIAAVNPQGKVEAAVKAALAAG
jgi:peroxiredoxin